MTSASVFEESLNTADYKVHVGVGDTKNFDTWSKTNLAVNKIIVHPNYERSTFQNDIALIKLRKRLNFDEKKYRIISVCIPEEQTRIFNDTEGYATGFGRANKNDKFSGHILNEVRLPILSDRSCEQFGYFKNEPIKYK